MAKITAEEIISILKTDTRLIEYIYEKLKERFATAETIKEILKRIDELRQDFNNMLTEQIKLREEQIRLRKDFQELGKEQIRLREDFKELREEQIKLREDFKELRKEQIRLRKDFEELRKEQIKLREDFKELRKDFIELRKDFYEARREQAEMNRRLEAMILSGFEQLRIYMGFAFEEFVRNYLSRYFQVTNVLPEGGRLSSKRIRLKDGREIEINIFYEDPFILGEITGIAEDLEKFERFLEKVDILEREFGRKAVVKVFAVNTVKNSVLKRIRRIGKEKGIEIFYGRVIY